MRIEKVNYSDQNHGNDLLKMLNEYALDEHGGREELSDFTKENLIQAMKSNGNTVSYLAYEGDRAIGLANCVFGFSSFAAKPLLNIHDLIVSADFRGKGVGTKLLKRVEDDARQVGCCKVTLEVLEQNYYAQKVYRNFGFEGYNLGEASNNALFWQKKLD